MSCSVAETSATVRSPWSVKQPCATVVIDFRSAGSVISVPVSFLLSNVEHMDSDDDDRDTIAPGEEWESESEPDGDGNAIACGAESLTRPTVLYLSLYIRSPPPAIQSLGARPAGSPADTPVMASGAPKRQRPNACHVLGITGSSRSGKTTLTQALLQRLKADGFSACRVCQDDHRQPSSDNVFNGRHTWEGSRFTAWPKLTLAVQRARQQHDVVLLEGYTILDGASILPMLEGCIWISSTKQQVISRRTTFPSVSRYGPLGWPHAKAYAEHCVWAAHAEYEQRTAAVFRGIPMRATLPASDEAAPRLEKALIIVGEWLAAMQASAGGCAAAAASDSLAPAAASTSSSAAPPSLNSSLPSPSVAPPSAAPSPSPSAAFAPTVARGPLVLVTHGSFNPVHRGHVAMMVRSKRFLEEEGFAVVGGVMAITRAEHIRAKGKQAYSDDVRCRLLALACASEPWLRHCGGAGVQVTSARAYASAHLAELGRQHGVPVRTATVEGSDVYLRYGKPAPKPEQLTLVVARAGELAQAAERVRTHKAAASVRVLSAASGEVDAAVDQGMEDASSTLVLQVLKRGDRLACVDLCGEAVAEELLRVGLPC